jgi:hypothetical protein
MIIPRVTEISALSAHRRDVAIGRWPTAMLQPTARSERPPEPVEPIMRVGDARPVSSRLPFTDW